MKQRHQEGFSLIEVLVAIALLGALVVPTCTALVMSHRINAKTDAVMQAQLAVSSAVETLMAEGISEVNCEYQTIGSETIDRFPDVEIKAEKDNTAPWYNVTVTDNDGLVTVETVIRAAPSTSEEEGGRAE